MKFSGLAAVVSVTALLVLGSTPLAVGLFPPPWDKLAHCVVYFIIGSFIALGFGRRRPLLGLIVTLLLGALDETLQFVEPGRMPELADLIADAAGAWAACLLAGHGSTTADVS